MNQKIKGIRNMNESYDYKLFEMFVNSEPNRVLNQTQYL